MCSDFEHRDLKSFISIGFIRVSGVSSDTCKMLEFSRFAEGSVQILYAKAQNSVNDLICGQGLTGFWPPAPAGSR